MEEGWGNSVLKWTIVICSGISLLLMAMGICVSFYRKIRLGSLKPVNCWFCNTTSEVLYTLRNSWNCPSCKQYNGFAQDGGYNKRIAAQHLQGLNPPVVPRGLVQKQNNRRPVRFNDNGLCAQCNLNQELKIFQLASFVPSSEVNFDKEIDDERNKLEKIYDLCSSCKKIVKSKLTKAAINEEIEDNGISQVGESGRQNVLKWSGKALLLSRKRASTDSLDAESRCSSSSAGTFHSTTASSDKTKYGSSVSMEVLENDDEVNGFDEVASLDRLSLGSPTGRLITPRLLLNGRSQCTNPSQYGRNNSTSFRSIASPESSVWKEYRLAYNHGHMVFGKRVTPSVGSFGSGLTGLDIPHSPYLANTEASMYRSSSVASIFGGKSSLVPSRLPLGSTQSTGTFGFHGCGPAHVWGLGLYYHNCFGPVPSSSMYSSFGATSGNPFYSHLSRASSQSSGFVSQGLHTPSPKPPPSMADSCTPSAFSANNSATNHESKTCDSFEGKARFHCQTPRKYENKWAGSWIRSNECSRFGPARSDCYRVPERRSPRFSRTKAAEKSRCYSSDSDDDLKEVQHKHLGQSPVKKGNSQRASPSAKREKEECTQGGQTSLTSVSASSSYLTGRKLLYWSLVATSLLLNLVFLTWLVFGFEIEALFGVIADFNRSRAECFQWIRSVAHNVNSRVMSHFAHVFY